MRKERFAVTVKTPRFGELAPISFHTTKEEIASGIGDHADFNNALRSILHDMATFAVETCERSEAGYDIKVERFFVSPPYRG